MSSDYENYGHMQEVIERDGLTIDLTGRGIDVMSHTCMMIECESPAVGQCMYCGHYMCVPHLHHQSHFGRTKTEQVLYTPAPPGVDVIMRRDPDAPVREPPRRLENMVDGDISFMFDTMMTILDDGNTRQMKRSAFWELLGQLYSTGREEERQRSGVQLKGKFGSVKDKDKWKARHTEVSNKMNIILDRN
jgi:hypothetical protein